MGKLLEENPTASKLHLARALLPEREALLAQYQTLMDRVADLAAQAEKSGSLMVAIQGLNSLRATLDSMAKLSGYMNTPPQVNVQVNLGAADIGAEIAKHLAGADAMVIEAVLDD